jgi:heat shock protein HslJ
MLSTILKATLTAAAAASLALAGCAADKSAKPPIMTADEVRTAVTGPWKVDAIEGQPVPAGVPTPTFEMREAGRVGGLAGVNRWSTSVDTAALGTGELKLGAVITTLMAGAPEAMQTEQRFLAALGKARTIDLESLKAGSLRVLDDAGAEMLAFVRE